MTAPNYNIVTFTPSASAGTAMAVDFDSGFKLKAGIEPDINHARVSFVEYQKLGSNPAVAGTLNFYFNSDGSGAAKPDMSIQSVGIVDAHPEENRAVAGNEGSIVPVVWRVYFADFREAFVAPRGGRLRFGVINPKKPVWVPYPDDTDSNSGGTSGDDGDDGDDDDAPDEPDESDSTTQGGGYPALVQNSELITDCLEAMGLPDSSLLAAAATAADQIDPPMDLEWHGNHAPTELQKLLDRCNLVFCPHLDGTATIEPLGTGDPPDLSGFNVASDVQLPGIDRRGSTVIYSSSPTPIMITEIIAGPSPDTWQFVVQEDGTDDQDNSWCTLFKPPKVMGGFTGTQLIQKNFSQLLPPPAAGAAPGTPPTTPPAILRLREQLYRCIRLNTNNYPPSRMPILKERYEKNPQFGKDPNAPPVLLPASILVNATTNVFDSSVFPPCWTADVDLDVCQVLYGHILIVAAELPLGSLANGTYDPSVGFVELTNGSLRVRFTHEQIDEDNRPLYWEDGYTRAFDGTITRLSPDQVQNSIAKPDRDTIFVHKPEWVNYIIDGVDVNGQAALPALAKADAQILLATSAVPERLVTIVGFAAIDISSQVPEINWHQHGVNTQVKIQSWYHPAQRSLHAEHLEATKPVNAYPAQGRTGASRAQSGMSGSTPAVATLRGPAPEPVPFMQIVATTQDGGAAGSNAATCTFTYTCKSLDGSITYGTQVVVDGFRPVNVQTTAGTLGLAYLNTGDGKLHLFYVNETWQQKNCG